MGDVATRLHDTIKKRKLSKIPVVLFQYTLSLIFILLLAACHDDSFNSESGGSDIIEPYITSIQITPVDAPSGEQNPGDQVAIGLSIQYKALAYYSNDTTTDVTKKALWSSTDNSVVTIDNNGLATGVKVGDTSISVTLDSVKSNVLPLSITEANITSISINGPSKTVKPLPVNYVAIATFTDGTSQTVTELVTWESSNTSVAKMEGNSAIPESTGDTNITAKYEGLSSDGISLEVVSLDPLDPDDPYGLTISPKTSTIIQGTSESYSIYAYINVSGDSNIGLVQPVDITKYVVFTSTDEAIVELERIKNENGQYVIRAKGMGVGEATITVSATVMGHNIEAAGQLTVSDAILESISVLCDENNIPSGLDTQCHANANYSHEDDISIPKSDVTSDAIWSSSDSNIATVGEQGLVTAVKGPESNEESSLPVTIYASVDSVLGENEVSITQDIITSLTITNTETQLSSGELQMHAFGTTTSEEDAIDITNRVSWSVEGEGATIDQYGKLTVTDNVQEEQSITISANIENDYGSFSDAKEITLIPIVGFEEVCKLEAMEHLKDFENCWDVKEDNEHKYVYPVSEKLLINHGFFLNYGATTTGNTYSSTFMVRSESNGIYSPVMRVATFNQVGEGANLDVTHYPDVYDANENGLPDDFGAGGQYDLYCKYLNEISLANVTTWRRATFDDMKIMPLSTITDFIRKDLVHEYFLTSTIASNTDKSNSGTVDYDFRTSAETVKDLSAYPMTFPQHAICVAGKS